MTLRSLWDQRARNRFKPTHERDGRMKMPHWSTYQKRKKDGETMPGVMSHILRPLHEASLEPYTCCGWAQASFRAARSFNLPAHSLAPATKSVTSFVKSGSMVSCPHCWDVVNDVATWLQIARGVASRYPDEVHLRWVHNEPGAACGINTSLCKSQMLYREFAGYIANNHEGDACSLCIAIFGRLFGVSRPEAHYAFYTTNEEAAAARKAMNP